MNNAMKHAMKRAKNKWAIDAASVLAVVAIGMSAASSGHAQDRGARAAPFQVVETTIDDIHAAFMSGRLTAHRLVQDYLDRIDAYDKHGPNINSIITLNPSALQEADRLDAAYRATGFVGPLHGIPILVKDEIDAAGMPTTLGTLVFKDYRPPRDAFVIDRLRKAGAIILGKTTLSEYAAGDTFGSMFGITRNPYDLDRTVGGSSGGSGAALAANFSTVAIGEETFASIRRPGAWNELVSLRPTPGLVSRSGMWDGYPTAAAQMGPMARTVTDLAKLLDAMVGYDPEDPVTALGIGKVEGSYAGSLVRGQPEGRADRHPARIHRRAVRSRIGGLQEGRRRLRAQRRGTESAGRHPCRSDRDPEPQSAARQARQQPDSVRRGAEALSCAQSELADQDPPGHRQFAGARQELPADQGGPVAQSARRRSMPRKYLDYLQARDELMFNVFKVMADNKLDAIVHKSVEHQPTLLKEELVPPYQNNRGVPTWNTFLVYAASMTVPSGFTTDNLPVGITFFGRPYSEPTLIRLAYSYEQATHHRAPPATTPPLPDAAP